jgi:hypothetical protein
MKKMNSAPVWCMTLLVCAVVSISSCKKDNNGIMPETQALTEETTTLAVAQEDAETEAIFDDVFNTNGSIGEADAGEDLGFGGNLPGVFSNGRDMNTDSTGRCFTVTVVPNIPHVFPKTVTINFGDGCIGRDGKLRKGKIVSIFTAPMRVPGSKVSTTFINYAVDSFKVQGTHITENTSTSNLNGWKVTVLNAKITNTNNNKWRSWNSLRSVTQIEGNGTPAFPLDNVFKITGGARGENSAGNQWSSTIQEPLIKKFTCRWIVKGTVKLIRDGREGLFDYGNGNCDNQATITINGVSYPVTL